MLKVAFICDDLMVGGWTSIVSTILNFKKNGMHPFAVCLFGKGYNAEILENAGVKVYFIGLNKKNAIYKFFELVSILRNERADIVHTNLHYSDIFGLSAAMFAGVGKRVVHIHSIMEKSRFELNFLKSFLLSRASVVVCVSDATADNFRKDYPSVKTEIRTIPNGIDICEFRRRFTESKYRKSDFGIPDDSFLVLTVANFKWQKGYQHLVAAAEQMDDPAVKFVIAGYGPEERKIRQMIKGKGLERKIVLLGMRTDVPELMKIADVFLLPSLVEPFGICIIEAFTCGVPVIATKVDGIRETASDMENAFLVDPGKPLQICDAIKKMVSRPDLREKIRLSALKRVNDFSIDIIGNRLKALYEEIV